MSESIVNPEFVDGDALHVVAAILWHRENPDRLLIARRQQGKHLEYLWEFPGGKKESGESPWEALVRELEEEIGIEASSGNPFMQVLHPYPEHSVLLDIWNVDAYSGEVRGREDQALAWVAVDELGAFCFPPADLPVLEAIRRSATAGTRRSS